MASAEFNILLSQLQQDETAPETTQRAREADLSAAGPLSEATDGLPSPTQIAQAAIDLVVASEVTSQQFYNKRLVGPTWPKGNSGLTIGIGYDVGTVDPATLESDWQGLLDAASIKRLAAACNITGPAAQTQVDNLADIKVPFDIAMKEFMTRSLPVNIGVTQRALPNSNLLGPSCLGALTSLVYNRGPSFQAKGDRYIEMRAIRAHMIARAFSLIPDEFRAMKHLWENDPNSRGLLIRRDAEADLFASGLGEIHTGLPLTEAAGDGTVASRVLQPNADVDDAQTSNVGDDVGAQPSVASEAATTPVTDWRVAKSLETLRAQINALAPNRSKDSDGAIGDLAHQGRESDHNPWVHDGGIGVVTARDFTHDPHGGCDAGVLAQSLIDSRDARIKYVIWNRRIASATISPFEWRPYDGANPHDHHCHVSVVSVKSGYDDTKPWTPKVS